MLSGDRGLSVFLFSVVLCLLIAAPASAAIKVTKIYFNPAGPDSGEGGHVRKEIVVIKNTGSRAVRLDGWRIHDAGRDHVYVFADRSRGEGVFTDIRLRPGGYVRIHSGKGQDSATASAHGDKPPFYDFYWDLDNYVWNNDCDKATLKNASKDFVDGCAYTSSADSPVAC